jgi:hypothetical protein
MAEVVEDVLGELPGTAGGGVVAGPTVPQPLPEYVAIGSAGFWEALALATYLLVQVGLPLLLALRERRMRRAGELL